MAAVTQPLSVTNGGLSVLSVTYDDVTFVVSALSWTNPSGTWVFTATKNGNVVATETLAPGASGSVAIPKGRGMHWLLDKTGADWTIVDEWHP